MNSVRIDRQKISDVIARGSANPPQSRLESLSIFDRMLRKQVVNGDVAGDERQAVGQLKASLAQSTLRSHSCAAQRGLVDQLQGQAGFDAAARLIAPSAQQIPCPQPQVFGDQ